MDQETQDLFSAIQKPITANSVGEAIGCVAVEWSHFEMLVEFLIWGIADLNQFVGRALTTHMNNQIRSDSLLALARMAPLCDAALREEIEKIVRQMNELSAKRNLIIHGLWDVNKSNNTAKIYNITMRGRFGLKQMDGGKEDILHVANEIRSIVIRIMELFSRERVKWPEVPL